MTLAELSTHVGFGDLSNAAVHHTKRLIADTIGCTFGGASHEIGAITRRFVDSLGGVAEARIVGQARRTSYFNAAFVNGSMAHALDNDDTFFNGSHPAAVAIWAALPVAERLGASGKTLIAAVATGYDIAARICLATETPGISGHKCKPVSSGRWQTVGPSPPRCAFSTRCRAHRQRRHHNCRGGAAARTERDDLRRGYGDQSDHRRDRLYRDVAPFRKVPA